MTSVRVTNSQPRTTRAGRKPRPQQISHNPHAYGFEVQQENKIVKATIHGNGSFVTNGAGDMLNGVTLDPSAIPNSDWADFSATYDEFRVVGCEIQIISLGPNSTTLNTGLLAIAFDNDSVTAPTSFSAVRQYGTASVHSLIMQHDQGRPLTLKYWRPVAGEDTSIPWLDVAIPSGSLGSVQIASTTATVSSTYLYYAINLFVEFRGRR